MKASILINTWLNHARENKTTFSLERCLSEIKEAGFYAVGLYGGESLLGSPRDVLRLTAKHQLEISAYGTSVTYNPYPPNEKQYRTDMRYAKALGVRILAMTGGFNYYGRRNQYPADYALFAGNLGTALKHAKKLGLQIAFYPHTGSIVETAAETRLILKRLPELKLCPDIGQLEAAGDVAIEFIRLFKSRLIYAMLTDFDERKNVFTELGKGPSRTQVADCIQALKKAGYTGWLTVALGKTFRTPLESAKISRRYLQKCGI